MKIIKNYLYNAGYQILAILLPLITTPYVSRVLGPQGVGDNAFTNSLVQYFVLLASIGIALYGNREIAYVRESSKNISKIFWEIQIVKTVATLLSLGMYIIFIYSYGRYTTYLWLQAINIVSVAFDISWLYMGIEDFKRTVIRNTLVKIISLILIFVFVNNSTDVGVYILILGLSTLFGNLTLWMRLKKVLVYIPLSTLKPLKHVLPTITLFMPQIATQVYLILNKTMLGMMVGTVASGYYNYSDNLVKMLLALATAMSTVMLPRISNEFSKGNLDKVCSLLYISFDYVSFISIPMAFGLAGIANNLIPIFYGKGYSPVISIMMIESIVIVLIGWSGTLGTQFLLPIKKVKAYTTSVMLGAVTNIIINFPLINIYGLKGAMIATVISEFVVTFYQIWYVKRIVEIKKLFKNTIKYFLSGIVMFFCVETCTYILHTGLVALFIQIVLGIVVYCTLILLLKPTIMLELKKIIKK